MDSSGEATWTLHNARHETKPKEVGTRMNIWERIRHGGIDVNRSGTDVVGPEGDQSSFVSADLLYGWYEDPCWGSGPLGAGDIVPHHSL